MTQDLAAFARERNIKYFLFNFTDLFGTQRAKLVPAPAVAGMQKSGAGFAGFAAWLDFTLLTRICLLNLIQRPLFSYRGSQRSPGLPVIAGWTANR